MSLSPVAASQTQSQSNVGGVLWALLAVGLFALIYVSGRLSGTNASALQIMWLRYLGGFLTMCVVLMTRRDAIKGLRTSQYLVHACRAGAGGFGGVAAVFAATQMPVASASAIGLLDGLFTAFLGLIFLREYVSPRQWCAIGLSLCGALIVVGSQGAFSVWESAYALPAGVALLGAILIAVESILIKKLVHREAAITVLFYVNLFGSIILAWPAMSYWVSISPTWVIGFLLLGPVAIVAQSCNINAFRAINASVVGTVRYTWIIYGSFFGVFFFDESISVLMGIGITTTLLGGCWLATLRNRSR